MSVSSHLDSLYEKHDNVEKRIEFAYSHHYADVDVARLKKEKLRLKDEIHHFELEAGEVA